MTPGDVIVACATPPGLSAVALVRGSGRGARDVLAAVAGRVPPPRRASLVQLRDARGAFDEGLATWFPGPSSYTGEDAFEVSCHGNPALVRRLLDACLAAGSRLAAPGEFTRRAVLHGRMDLLQAEAVLATLQATSDAGLELARRVLSGELGAVLAAWRDELLTVAAELEARLDYPGEDLLFTPEAALEATLERLRGEVEALVRRSRATRRSIGGARVAVVGPVNAGKSTLVNALAGRRRVLVSAHPGTTRDVVSVTVPHPLLQIELLDTAGHRAGAETVEAEGIALGLAEAREADLRLFLHPGHLPWDPSWDALLADLPSPTLRVTTHADLGATGEHPVSGTTGEGVADLLEAVVARLLDRPADPTGASSAPGVTAAWQEDLLRDLGRRLGEAGEGFFAGPAVVASLVHDAIRVLDALVGRDTGEEVLDRLFQRFCVGK